MVRSAIRRYQAAFSGLPREVWMLALVLFVNRCGTMVLPFLTLYLTSQFNMSDAAAGSMISVYGLGAICGAYLSGRLAESIGAIRLQTLCMFLAAPSCLLIAAWNSWLPIAASVFVFSFVSEAVRPANATSITKLTTPENRTRAFALQRLATNLGLSFGPAVGGFLSYLDFRLLFLADALTTLLAASTLFYFFRMRALHGSQPESAERTIRVSPIKDRGFVVYLSLILLVVLVFSQWESTYPLYLRDHFGFSQRAIGLMFTVNTVFIVAIEMLLVDYVKRWPSVRTIGWGCLLACLGFGILPFGSSAAFCVFAMLVFTSGEMLTWPLSSGFVANRSPRGSESLYMGWYTVIQSTGSVLGPMIGSWIYQIDRDALWLIGLAIGAVVWAGFQLLAIRLHKSSQRSTEPLPVAVIDGTTG